MERNKILIVDDVFQVRYSLHQYLTACGYIVFDADSGIKAIETCERFKPDLIITDYNLRDMTCFELLEALRRYENNLKDVIRIKNIPAIVISGYLQEENIAPIKKRLGITGFMRKPLILPELLTHIESAFGNDYYMTLNAAKEIVICDSEYRTAKYLANFLVQHNFNSYYCANIIDFMDLVGEVKPDLLLFDCFTNLTGFNDFNLFEICEKQNKDYTLILTTFHNPCRMQKLYQHFGVSQVVSKPIDLDFLLTVVKRAFQDKAEKILQEKAGKS